MSNRAEFLDKFGLPDCDAFEMEPERDVHGIWRIKVSCEGHIARHMSQGHAAKLAEVIRSVEPNLAEQIDACIAEARRLKNSN